MENPAADISAFRIRWRRALRRGGLGALAAAAGLVAAGSPEGAAGWLFGAAGGLGAFVLLCRQTERRAFAASSADSPPARRSALSRFAVRSLALAACLLTVPRGLPYAVAALLLSQIVLAFLIIPDPPTAHPGGFPPGRDAGEGRSPDGAVSPPPEVDPHHPRG